MPVWILKNMESASAAVEIKMTMIVTEIFTFVKCVGCRWDRRLVYGFEDISR
jgi:hypothetical protein